MKRLAEDFRERLGAGQAPDSGAIQRAVSNFVKAARVSDYRDLRLLSYGLTVRPGAGATAIIERPALLEKLLAAIEAIRDKARQFRRCCQGLLAAYFGVDSTGMPGAAAGWSSIRSFLARERRTLVGTESPPDWVMALEEHKNLLSDSPCDRYAKAFLDDDTREFESACSRLAIGSQSWVRESVVLSAVRAAGELPDPQFVSRIHPLLKLLSGAKNVQAMGIRAILNRYAQMASRPSHQELRQVSLALFGNPLLTRNAPAWAPTHVTPAARQMVADWLKLDVIGQFFQLLSHDGATDRRRPQFWSQYVPIIENIWIVFGPAGQDRHNADFQALHKLLGDQALRLSGSTRHNNAFVMKIGSRYVIEFGETGNAAYIYDKDTLPFELAGTLDLRTELKAGSLRLRHNDSSERWEDKFIRRLGLRALMLSAESVQQQATAQAAEQARAIAAAQAQARRDAEAAARATARAHERQDAAQSQFRQQAGPAEPEPVLREEPVARGSARTNALEQEFREFCVERGLAFQDERHRGGRLTVRASNRNPTVTAKLRGWGFVYNDLEERWTLR
jgi:hypothetical protein